MSSHIYFVKFWFFQLLHAIDMGLGLTMQNQKVKPTWWSNLLSSGKPSSFLTIPVTKISVIQDHRRESFHQQKTKLIFRPDFDELAKMFTKPIGFDCILISHITGSRPTRGWISTLSLWILTWTWVILSLRLTLEHNSSMRLSNRKRTSSDKEREIFLTSKVDTAIAIFWTVFYSTVHPATMEK